MLHRVALAINQRPERVGLYVSARFFFFAAWRRFNGAVGTLYQEGKKNGNSRRFWGKSGVIRVRL
jgi:hypothetical protein